MNGSTDEQEGGWIYRMLVGYVDAWISGWMVGRIDESMAGGLDWRMSASMEGSMDDWIDGCKGRWVD